MEHGSPALRPAVRLSAVRRLVQQHGGHLPQDPVGSVCGAQVVEHRLGEPAARPPASEPTPPGHRPTAGPSPVGHEGLRRSRHVAQQLPGEITRVAGPFIQSDVKNLL